MNMWNYIVGFVLSLVTTLTATQFVLMGHHSFTVLAVVLGVLAVLQIVVQLVCFLHIGSSPERLYLLLGTLLVVLILVIGSLWIMITLNGRMMPADMQMEYMHMESGL